MIESEFKESLARAEGGSLADQYNVGFYYVSKQEREAAIKYLRLAAEQGHTVAQNFLAALHLSSGWIEKEEGLEWSRRSMAAGNLDGGYLYACFVRDSDPATAANLFTQAAENGNADAQFFLGEMYLRGKGVTRDNRIAQMWVTRAVQNNSAQARERHFNTESGIGNFDKIEKLAQEGKALAALRHVNHLWQVGRFEEALAWLRKLSEQNYAEALNRLSQLYRSGNGVDQSDEIADSFLMRALDAENHPT